MSEQKEVIHWHPFDWKDKSTYPKEDGWQYLITVRDSDGSWVASDYWMKGNWWESQELYENVGNVVAWAEMPDPYKKEGCEE